MSEWLRSVCARRPSGSQSSFGLRRAGRCVLLKPSLAAEVLEPRCVLTSTGGFDSPLAQATIVLNSEETEITVLHVGNELRFVQTGTDTDLVPPQSSSRPVYLQIVGRTDGTNLVTLQFGSESNDITVDSVEGRDGLSEVTDGSLGLTIQLSSLNGLTIQAGGGNDRVTVLQSKLLPRVFDNWNYIEPLRINGESGDDTLSGGLEADDLLGGFGDDSLSGGGGDDWLTGYDFALGDQSDGNDTLVGGDGCDYLNGGSGNDLVLGGEGDDLLYGGAGDDTLRGAAGRDDLEGDEGNDVLDGGDGNDWLGGWDGNDLLMGGDGDDELHAHEGNDTLLGQAGNDKLHAHYGADLLDGGSGDDGLDGDTYSSDSPFVDTMYGGGGDGDYLDDPGDNDVIDLLGAWSFASVFELACRSDGSSGSPISLSDVIPTASDAIDPTVTAPLFELTSVAVSREDLETADASDSEDDSAASIADSAEADSTLQDQTVELESESASTDELLANQQFVDDLLDGTVSEQV